MLRTLFYRCLCYYFFLLGALPTMAQRSVPVGQFQAGVGSAGAQLLDVRTLEEFNNGHIPAAFQANWYSMKEFEERVSHLDRTKPVFVYCQTGIRSQKAAKLLTQKGFTVTDLEGGFTKWQLSGKPTESLLITEQLTQEAYEKQLLEAEYTLVDFGATWCAPCKKMEPIIEKLTELYKNKVSIVKVDGARQIEILKQLSIAAFPTLVFYKQGQEIWRNEGLLTLEEIIQKIENK